MPVAPDNNLSILADFVNNAFLLITAVILVGQFVLVQ